MTHPNDSPESRAGLAALSAALQVHTTPNHWQATKDFVAHPGLPLDQEFDLVAPVFIYLAADLKYGKEAQAAARKLQAAQHPLVEGFSVAALMAGSVPDNIGTRYQQLMMAIVEEELPGAEPFIDAWGAFAFRAPQGSNDDRGASFLDGDAAGSFAYYISAALVRSRVRQFLGATPDAGGPAAPGIDSRARNKRRAYT